MSLCVESGEGGKGGKVGRGGVLYNNYVATVQHNLM